MPLSIEEEINVDFQSKPKNLPKIVRVLTVLAYILSVSMAAILLSIYYIFMWQGRPQQNLHSLKQEENYYFNDAPKENYTHQDILFNNFTNNNNNNNYNNKMI